MNDVKTFSLSRHSRLFSVPDSGKDYLFVRAGHPYYEEPYRAESYAIVFVKEGAVRLHVGLSTIDVTAPSIITLGASVIRYFTKSSDQLEMDVIFFRETFLLERHPDPFFLSGYDFFEHGDFHVLSLPETGVIKFRNIYALFRLAQDTASYHQAELIRSYIFALIYEIDDYHRQRLLELPAQTKSHSLLNSFKKLLRNNYKRERKLEFYAAQLHLTPKSLSAAIKKQSGRPAGTWINDAVILEAKVLLQNKALTVSQVSGLLNFSDQSVFGKFFRAGAGMSPLEYRKKFE